MDTQLNALDADRDMFAAELNLAQTRCNELLALVQLPGRGLAAIIDLLSKKGMWSGDEEQYSFPIPHNPPLEA